MTVTAEVFFCFQCGHEEGNNFDECPQCGRRELNAGSRIGAVVDRGQATVFALVSGEYSDHMVFRIFERREDLEAFLISQGRTKGVESEGPYGREAWIGETDEKGYDRVYQWPPEIAEYIFHRAGEVPPPDVDPVTR